jgi:hypothetical protein
MAVGRRHGRHTNAAADPSNSPPARVNVDKYMKLTRSTPPKNGTGPGPLACSHHVQTMKKTATPASQRAMVDGRSRPAVSATKTRGQTR